MERETEMERERDVMEREREREMKWSMMAVNGVPNRSQHRVASVYVGHAMGTQAGPGTPLARRGLPMSSQRSIDMLIG